MHEPDNCGARPTILCVDDEPSVLQSLERLFRRAGWRVLRAASGDEALALLQQEAVDVLVCDHAMPGMPGTEVLRRAKNTSPGAARILLTAHWGEGPVALSAVNEAEIFRIVPKPWDDEQMRSAAEQALGTDPAAWAGFQQRMRNRLHAAMYGPPTTEEAE